MRNVYYYDSAVKNGVNTLVKKRALLINTPEWSKLHDHLTRADRLQESIDQKRLKDGEIRQLSKDMSEKWDNTILNMRKRRFESWREKREHLEEFRRKRYILTRKEEEEIKKKINQDAKELLRQEKDGLKLLTSSLRFAETLRVRADQIKFEKKLKEIEDERERKYEEKIVKDVLAYEEEQKEEKFKELERKKMLNEEAKALFKEAHEKKRKEDEIRLNQEREDLINIDREIKLEQENARKEIEYKKKLIMDDVISNRIMIEKLTIQKKLEDEEEEAAVDIHATCKKKIAMIRKMKEEETRERNQQRREKISAMVAAEEADKSAQEEAILQRAIAKKEALEEQVNITKKNYQDRLVNELKEERERFLESEKQRKINEREVYKWNMMQRLKLTEENEKFFEEKKIEANRRIEELREEWDKDIAERAEKAAKETAEIVHYEATKWDQDDKDFFEYADVILEESKKKGRPLFPINKSIEEYKKAHIKKPPSQHKIWKSNVPIDSHPTVAQKEPELQTPVQQESKSSFEKNKDDQDEKSPVGRSRKSVEPWPSQKEICKKVPKKSNGLH